MNYSAEGKLIREAWTIFKAPYNDHCGITFIKHGEPCLVAKLHQRSNNAWGDAVMIIFGHLKDLRSFFERSGLENIGCSSCDDESILESWV